MKIIYPNISKIFCLLFTAAVLLTAMSFKSEQFAETNLSDSTNIPGTNQKEIHDFLKAEKYKSWQHDMHIRETGPVIKGVDGTTHHRVRIYYSDEVITWLKNGKKDNFLPDGSMIVKEMYETNPADGDSIIGWAAIVKKNGVSNDGWFWSIYFLPDPNHARMAPMGDYGYSYCLSCHASANNNQLTFSTYEHVLGKNEITYNDTAVYDPHRFNFTKTFSRTPGKDKELYESLKPLSIPDEKFLKIFSMKSPTDNLEKTAFPNTGNDYVTEKGGFITSSNCVGCHDASDLIDVLKPNMSYVDADSKKYNLSEYGEWSASLMGLAGRDPVFHAQLESELYSYPELSNYLQNTCYRCHGVMGQRQIHTDLNENFKHEMVYETKGDKFAKYGALARDGVSCAACHFMSEKGLGDSTSFTGNFRVEAYDEANGPFHDPKIYAMQNALDLTPQYKEHLTESKLCGSCHTVVLPIITDEDKKYKGNPAKNPKIEVGHEQATYLEWRNSIYQNEVVPVSNDAQTCQNCHMPSKFKDKGPLSFKLANIQDNLFPPVDNLAPTDNITLEKREGFARHQFTGANFFVIKMFQQFAGILGIEEDTNTPTFTVKNLVMSENEGIKNLQNDAAKIDILSIKKSNTDIDAAVRVINLAGHKFPSGVGFRRLFIEFTVYDSKDNILWRSGNTDALGVINDGKNALETEFSDTKFQKHYQTITKQDEVQIYEHRLLNSEGKLTTSFLGLLDEVKDNRLLPKGWNINAAGYLLPTGIENDSQYYNGSGTDEIHYIIPLNEISGADHYTAVLYYQSIPPYYLKDRFTIGKGIESQRLYDIASRLKLEGSKMENWKLMIAKAHYK